MSIVYFPISGSKLFYDVKVLKIADILIFFLSCNLGALGGPLVEWRP